MKRNAWFITQRGTASPIPLTSSQTEAISTLPTKTLPQAGSPLPSVPKRTFKTILEGGKASALKATQVRRSPMEDGRALSPKDSGRVKDRDLTSVPTRRDAANFAPLGSAQLEIAALKLNLEVILSPVHDTSWESDGTGDFNADGRTDILWRYHSEGSHQGLTDIWDMNRATFLRGNILNVIPDMNWSLAINEKIFR